jgi:hypothetical protein
MANRLRIWATLLWALMSLDTIARADTPIESFEVVTVTSSRVIKHEVDLKGPFDVDAVERFLVGPQLFSHAIGFEKDAIQQPKAYLNWFKIAKPANEPKRVVTVRDALRGENAREITIDRPAYLLSPAQRLGSGSPGAVPDSLNYFMAYTIDGAPEIKQQVKLTGAFGPEDRTATKAVFLCVPVEQWHHDEHAPIKNAKRCLVVYELLSHKHEITINTMDQFGLNKLEAQSSDWLAVDAEIVDGERPKAR